MSEQPYDTDESTEDSGDNLVTLRRSQIKSIERKAKERDQMAAQLEQAQRRLAFAEAGIPLGDKRTSYFIKGYDGDLTAEAIRAAAIEDGFLPDGDAPPQQGQTTVDGQVEQQALRAIYSASQGAGTPEPGDAERAAEQAFQQGGQEGLMAYLAQQGVPLYDGD